MMRALLTLVRHDLVQHLRDRSMLLFAVLIPLALALVFGLVLSGVDDVELDPVTVAISAPEDDPAAQAVVQVLEGVSGQGLDVSVQRVGAQEVEGLVDSGEAGVGVVVPAGLWEGMPSADPSSPPADDPSSLPEPGAEADRSPGEGVVIHQGPDAGLSGEVVSGIVSSTVQRMDADAAALSALAQEAQEGAVDLSGEQLGAVAEQLGQARPEVAWTSSGTGGERLGVTSGIVAGQAGMFLFFTVGFAVLTLITEREWGTLDRLRTMPIPRWLVPLAKAVVAVLIGIVSTSVILLAGGLLLDGVDFGPWLVVLPLVAATVVAATSVMFIILKVARTSEQASLAMSVVAITLGVGGGTFFQIPTDGWLGQLLQVNPVAALGRGLGITAGGGGLGDLVPVLLTLLSFTVVVLLIARVVPGRKDAL